MRLTEASALCRPEAGARRRLPPGTVDVWLTATDAPCADRLESWLALMTEAERARHERFVAPKAKLQHLLARVLVRTVLSRYAAVEPQEWRFETNAYSRPAIAAPVIGQDLRFNLSHTDGLVALAVSEGTAVGIDVEQIDRDIDVMALAPSVMAASELRALERTPPEARRDLFFGFWTLKEAYIKARGMGLSLPLGGFAFDLSGASPTITFDPARIADDATAWTFRRFAPTPRHFLAVAVERTRFDLSLEWVDLGAE